MKRLFLFLSVFSAGLYALDRFDNPPPGTAALHTARTMEALARADAGVTRAALTIAR